jgi:hypothetical protein
VWGDAERLRHALNGTRAGLLGLQSSAGSAGSAGSAISRPGPPTS